MVEVPNPLIDPVAIPDLPIEELLKVALVGMILMGFFVGWISKKINELGNKTDRLGRWRD